MSETGEWFRKDGYMPSDIFTAGDVESAYEEGIKEGMERSAKRVEDYGKSIHVELMCRDSVLGAADAIRKEAKIV